MFKLKENKMTYYLLGSNTNYNMPFNLNTFVPTLFYPTYENCAVFSPMIFNDSLSNFQCVYPSNSTIVSENQISDTREPCSQNQSENSS